MRQPSQSICVEQRSKPEALGLQRLLALVNTNSQAARAELGSKFLACRESGDNVSACLAWCGLMAARFRTRQFPPDSIATSGLAFAQEYFSQIDQAPMAVQTAIWIYAETALLRQHTPDISRWEKVALDLIMRHGSADQCVTFGIIVAGRRLWHCASAQIFDAIAARVDEMVASEFSSGQSRIAWLSARIHCALLYPDRAYPRGVAAMLADAVDYAQHTGIEVDDTPLGSAVFVHDLLASRLDEARAYFQRTTRFIELLSSYDAWIMSFYKTWFLLEAWDTDAALLEATRGYAFARSSGVFHTLAWAKFAVARASVATERAIGNWSRIADARNEARRAGIGLLETLCRLVSALAALARGRKFRAAALATVALTRIEHSGMFRPPLFTRADLERLLLCVQGKHLHGDTASVLRKFYVIDYAEQVQTKAPATAEYEIRCLGGFSIYRKGQLLKWPRKSPQRPLELLKATIALGRTGASIPELLDALWPGSDGDRARRAFATALYRLRGLLGERALVLNGGRLSIDRSLVYVDAFAFEEAAAAYRRLEGEPDKAVIDLYRGEFLADHPDVTWAIAARNRLRERYRQVVRSAEENLLATGRWREALELLENALERDPVAEVFYQGALAACLAGGLRAEASVLYERCKMTLAERLGISPSPKTESIYRAVLRVAR